MNIVSSILGAGIVGKILQVILKKFLPKSKFIKGQNKVFKIGKGFGRIVTLGATKAPVIKNFWNSVIEPYVILLLDFIAKGFINGFIEGLKTDNQSFKE